MRRLVALAGTTLFGVILVFQVIALVNIYIEIYQLAPPPFPIPSYHRFPIYRLNRDLLCLLPIVAAFACSLALYLRSSKPSKNMQRA